MGFKPKGAALARSNAPASDRVVIGGMDVTGISSRFAEWLRAQPPFVLADLAKVWRDVSERVPTLEKICGFSVRHRELMLYAAENHAYDFRGFDYEEAYGKAPVARPAVEPAPALPPIKPFPSRAKMRERRESFAARTLAALNGTHGAPAPAPAEPERPVQPMTNPPRLTRSEIARRRNARIQRAEAHDESE